MARYEIAPTRTNLIRLKGDLSLIHEGHELLEQKRQILILELKGMTARAVEAQRKVDAVLEEAHAALRAAEIAAGETSVRSGAVSARPRAEVRLSERRVMGVGIPHVEVAVKEEGPEYGVHTTSVWMDVARARFRDVVEAIAGLAEARITVVRLARAIQKTMRRVNALEKILIPDYEDTVKYVEDSLEESDRQALFNLKLVKERLEQRAGARKGAKASRE